MAQEERIQTVDELIDWFQHAVSRCRYGKVGFHVMMHEGRPTEYKTILELGGRIEGSGYEEFNNPTS